MGSTHNKLCGGILGMNESWKYSICQNCSQQIISNPDNYVSEIDDCLCSPIDRYYKSKNEILRLGVPRNLTSSWLLGDLLLIGIMSATERYFRDLFSSLVNICPISREAASGQSINISSVLWSKKYGLKKGLFENISFADKKTIISACKSYLGYDILQSSLSYAMLGSYEKVCQLRHCVVHAGSHWVAKNAINFGVEARDEEIQVEINFDNLQECIAICTNLVTCFNLELFEQMCKRWAIDWRKRPDWKDAEATKKFNIIWELFFSNIDTELIEAEFKMTKRKCMNMVKCQYHI